MKQKTILKGVKISQLELERAYDKIHAWFFAFPQSEFSLNELSKALEISKATANLVVSQLVKDNFLNVTKLGKLWRIKANQRHKWFETRKIPFNLRIIYECGIIEWIEENIKNKKAVVLFGSYRNGDDIKESDLDIAVEVSGKQALEIYPAAIQKFGYRDNVKMNLHLFSRSNIDLNLFANIANGIVLNGFLEVRP